MSGHPVRIRREKFKANETKEKKLSKKNILFLKTRVTRLGESSPIGRVYLYFGPFLDNY
jgi:hypothetical protein